MALRPPPHIHDGWYHAILILLIGGGLLTPVGIWAHGKGLYNTQPEAANRAKELGCQGTHQNNGLWMPCANEEALHKALREE
ncbi:MAG: DUF3721 domain-containing protein [Cyanobacteriota bacterium]|nr:DUF3721 domain-containing protein [Cyanobacteriota bacterium]